MGGASMVGCWGRLDSRALGQYRRRQFRLLRHSFVWLDSRLGPPELTLPSTPATVIPFSSNAKQGNLAGRSEKDELLQR